MSRAGSWQPSRVPASFALLAVLFLLPAVACRGAEEVDWVVTRPADVPRAELEFRFVLDGKAEGALEVADAEGARIWVGKEILISSADLYEVHVNLEGDIEHYAVTLYFTPQAAQRLHEATTNNLGRQVAILLNGFVVVAPTIQTPIGPSAMISSRYTKDDAVRLAQQIAP